MTNKFKKEGDQKIDLLEKIIEDKMDFYMWRIKQYKTIRNVPNLPGIIEFVVRQVARETAIDFLKDQSKHIK